MGKEFWSCFQLFLGHSKLPSFLVDILKVTGYDSPISVELLDKEKIGEIQTFIEANYGCTHILLKDTVYENKEEFRLLPGHITLLLGLKTYANKYLDLGIKKQKEKSDSTKYKVNELDTVPEEVEVLSSDELNKLKTLVVQKISKYCRKINIDTENLSNSLIGDDWEIIINSNGKAIYKTIF